MLTGQTALVSVEMKVISTPLKITVQAECTLMSHGCFTIHVLMFFMALEENSIEVGFSYSPELVVIRTFCDLPSTDHE